MKIHLVLKSYTSICMYCTLCLIWNTEAQNHPFGNVFENVPKSKTTALISHELKNKKNRTWTARHTLTWYKSMWKWKHQSLFDLLQTDVEQLFTSCKLLIKHCLKKSHSGATVISKIQNVTFHHSLTCCATPIAAAIWWQSTMQFPFH